MSSDTKINTTRHKKIWHADAPSGAKLQIHGFEGRIGASTTTRCVYIVRSKEELDYLSNHTSFATIVQHQTIWAIDTERQQDGTVILLSLATETDCLLIYRPGFQADLKKPWPIPNKLASWLVSLEFFKVGVGVEHDRDFLTDQLCFSSSASSSTDLRKPIHPHNLIDLQLWINLSYSSTPQTPPRNLAGLAQHYFGLTLHKPSSNQWQKQTWLNPTDDEWLYAATDAFVSWDVAQQILNQPPPVIGSRNSDSKKLMTSSKDDNPAPTKSTTFVVEVPNVTVSKMNPSSTCIPAYSPSGIDSKHNSQTTTWPDDAQRLYSWLLIPKFAHQVERQSKLSRFVQVAWNSNALGGRDEATRQRVIAAARYLYSQKRLPQLTLLDL